MILFRRIPTRDQILQHNSYGGYKHNVLLLVSESEAFLLLTAETAARQIIE